MLCDDDALHVRITLYDPLPPSIGIRIGEENENENEKKKPGL